MRQVSGYMKAFGLTEDEIDTVCIRNPAMIVKANVEEALQRAHPLQAA